MEPNETEPARTRVPAQIIAALVILYLNVAAGLFLTVILWSEYSARIEHNQEPGPERALAILSTIVAVVALGIAIGLHRRSDPARLTGLALGTISVIIAVIALIATQSLQLFANLGISVTLVVSLTSEPAKEWCEK